MYLFHGNVWKLKQRQSFIVDGAEKLKAKCAATLEYDAIVNFNPAWGYHFEGNEPKRLMIVSLKGNKLDTGEEIKLGTVCEKVLKDIAADESKVGRFLKALYKLLGYAQVHKYEGLSSKLREILNKNDSTDALIAPAFELSPIQLFDSMHLIAAYQSNTDKFLFVANDALVLRPEVSSSQDQQSLLAWIQRKVEQFWELYRNSSEQRGTLLDMARSLDQGLVRLTSDYDEGYKEFSAPLREIRIKFEQKIADEQKNIVKSLREGQRKSSIFDWLATGATQFNTEKVKKCLKSSFGDALTDQAFKFSFGSSSPKENLSNGDIYFILRKISKEVEKISSAQLVQQYSLEAEGFVVGIKEA